MGLKEKLIVHFIKIELMKARYKPMFDKLKKLYAATEGQKTYFMLAGIVLTEIVFAFGFIGPEQKESLYKIFGTGAAAAMADKINRMIRVLRELKIIQGLIESVKKS